MRVGKTQKNLRLQAADASCLERRIKEPVKTVYYEIVSSVMQTAGTRPIPPVSGQVTS